VTAALTEDEALARAALPARCGRTQEGKSDLEGLQKAVAETAGLELNLFFYLR